MSSCVTQDGLFHPASQTVKPANLGPKALKTTGQLATTPVRRQLRICSQGSRKLIHIESHRSQRFELNGLSTFLLLRPRPAPRFSVGRRRSWMRCKAKASQRLEQHLRELWWVKFQARYWSMSYVLARLPVRACRIGFGSFELSSNQTASRHPAGWSPM